MRFRPERGLSTFATSVQPSPTSSSYQHEPHPRVPTFVPNHRQFSAQGDGAPTSIVININDGGSTGRGILIGLLSAFGSAGIAVLVLAIFFFFKYTSRGRIILDRIGRPGEFDDEQAFAREEAEALEHMDDMQRTEYMRAKGMFSIQTTEGQANGCSVYLRKSARNRSHRHIIITIFSNSRKRCFGMGVRARA